MSNASTLQPSHATATGAVRQDRLAATGAWLQRHRRPIAALQWTVVLVYGVLVIVPALLPLPARTEHLWSSAAAVSQFVFWGLWWPLVLLSTAIVGRGWCGLFCPEDALSEFASRHGRGRAIPRWVRWGGWPFVAFAGTTIYGQMLSVYQYPRPALLILGGSTLAAIAVGASYGRGKRVWCRYLCPVSGVFGLLAKLAPLHFKVDPVAWQISQLPPKRLLAPVDCAPLVPIRTMRGASQCHMCGRCSGFRDAVTLSARSPNDEIVNVAGATPRPWETALIVFGMMGVASGAFQWSQSLWFITAKQAIAAWLVRREILWPLETTAPWWILTNYPGRNDVLNLLDGALLLGYIGTAAAVLGGLVCAFMALATRALGPWSWARFHHLAQCLIPLAGCVVFLGLSSLTVALLRTEGLPLGWVGGMRVLLGVGASLWVLWLAAAVARLYTSSPLRRVLATLSVSGAVVIGNLNPDVLLSIW